MSLLALKSFGSTSIAGNGAVAVLEGSVMNQAPIATRADVIGSDIYFNLGGKCSAKLNKDTMVPSALTGVAYSSMATTLLDSFCQTPDGNGDFIIGSNYRLAKRSIANVISNARTYVDAQALGFIVVCIYRLSTGKYILLTRQYTSGGTNYYTVLCLNADLTLYWSRRLTYSGFTFLAQQGNVLEAANGDIFIIGNSQSFSPQRIVIFKFSAYGGLYDAKVYYSNAGGGSNTLCYSAIIRPDSKLMLGFNSANDTSYSGMLLINQTMDVYGSFGYGVVDGLKVRATDIVFDANGDYYLFDVGNYNYLTKRNGVTDKVIWSKRLGFSIVNTSSVGLKIVGDYLYFTMVAYTNKMAFFKIPLTGPANGTYNNINGTGTTLTIQDGAFPASPSSSISLSTFTTTNMLDRTSSTTTTTPTDYVNLAVTMTSHQELTF